MLVPVIFALICFPLLGDYQFIYCGYAIGGLFLGYLVGYLLDVYISPITTVLLFTISVCIELSSIFLWDISHKTWALTVPIGIAIGGFVLSNSIFHSSPPQQNEFRFHTQPVIALDTLPLYLK